MTVSPTDFGGPWTLTKLDILKDYLDAYTTALKNKPFRLIYVDAFAGSGFWRPRSVHDPDIHEGSAALALAVDDRQFDRLIFIEKEEARCSSLQQLARTHTGRNVKVVNKDANEAIPALCRAFEPYDRAVVFLDPFAIELSWCTVSALADTKRVDCGILFPLGAVARLMPLKHNITRTQNYLVVVSTLSSGAVSTGTAYTRTQSSWTCLKKETLSAPVEMRR